MSDEKDRAIGGRDLVGDPLWPRRPVSDEAIEAIVDALVDASDNNVDELEGFAEYVLDGLRAAGFELYRLDDMTEGDGIWWCERHQCRWGYTPDCGWSPRGEACPKSRRLLIEWPISSQ